jgi:arsenate reductase (thioredoxin)
LLGLVIIAVATDRRAVRGMGGLAIGLTVGLASLSVGGLTGASLNPARTLGPALASGQYAHLWLYIAAPVLGALSGMAAYEGLRGHRHAPELGSLGPIHLERPSILFACVGNSARSQMAEAFARRMAPRLDIRSGGSQPLGFILPETIAVMQERGFDLRHHTSKPFDEEWIRNECDLVVTMGCGDACPAFIGKRIVDWELADPKGQSIEAFRQVRDDIEKRVAELLRAEAR